MKSEYADKTWLSVPRSMSNREALLAQILIALIFAKLVGWL